ncbi:MAG: 2-phospho-L-lactate guanylyltransferase [Pseudolabrys sp.]|nr:2-phospho-L-lactate guanylyltransferase [Pseudolabrys sp.]
MSHQNIWAVVPIKPFATAKMRLADVLTPLQRRQLARLMAHDVLETLAASRHCLAGVLVVTADPEAAALAQSHGAEVLPEPAAAGINQALALAASRLTIKNNTSAMIVVPTDLPQLTVAAVERLVQLLPERPSIALVPATEDGGTNLLALRPARVIPTCFGADSFERHRKAAREAGHLPSIVRGSELGRDIDRPEDLDAFISLRTATRSHAFLVSLALTERAAASPQPADAQTARPV